MDLLLLAAFAALGLALVVFAGDLGRLAGWIHFVPFLWFTNLMWGENNRNFTRAGVTTLVSWYLRIFGVLWLIVVGLALGAVVFG